MPERKTLERARRAKGQGKAATTQAGVFVREEIEHVREGKHGARSAKQAIAIGLSKARRAGVALKAPTAGTSKRTRTQAARDTRSGQRRTTRKRSTKRSEAASRALKREPKRTASRKALSKHASAAARRKRRSDA